MDNYASSRLGERDHKAASNIWWFVFPFTFVIVLASGIRTYVEIVASEIRLRKRMRGCGRFLSRRELVDRIAEQGPGTLIIENPSTGRHTHAWWTANKIMELAPTVAPTRNDYGEAVVEMRCLDWDRWHWENYVSPETGSAFLLRVWSGESIERQLKRRFPELDVVFTWTALCQMGT